MTTKTALADKVSDLDTSIQNLSEQVTEVEEAVISPDHGTIFFLLNEIRTSIRALEQKLNNQSKPAAD